MHPPHRPKRNESGEKSVSMFVKTFFFCFFGDHLNLGEKNVWISDFGRKISLNFGEDLFFFCFLFFFFLETTWIWAKKTFESPISAEKSLSILVKTFFFFIFYFLETTWRYPNFWGFVLQIPPTKIFWIRHCLLRTRLLHCLGIKLLVKTKNSKQKRLHCILSWNIQSTCSL